MKKSFQYPWIPTSKRNPRVDGEYEATVEFNHIFGQGRYVDLVKFEVRYGWSLRSNDYKVVAWHKKPEPYKEATHDNQSGL